MGTHAYTHTEHSDRVILYYSKVTEYPKYLGRARVNPL